MSLVEWRALAIRWLAGRTRRLPASTDVGRWHQGANHGATCLILLI